MFVVAFANDHTKMQGMGGQVVNGHLHAPRGCGGGVAKEKLNEPAAAAINFDLSEQLCERHDASDSPTGGDFEGANPAPPAYEYELSTMPGWAGSSWYWYRYMDAHNDHEFASKELSNTGKTLTFIIQAVREHATGHLLYSRFWNKFLKDINLVVEEEPVQKLINQGMIQGRSNFV